MAWQPPAEAFAPGAPTWAPPAEANLVPAPSLARDYAQQIAHGLGRGTAALGGVVGDVLDLEGQAASWLSERLGMPIAAKTAARISDLIHKALPTSAQTVESAQRNLIGPQPATASPGAAFAGRVATYVPGAAAMGGPAGLAARAALGAASGIASEGAAEAGLPPVAQVAAGLLPGLGVAGAQTYRGAASRAVGQALPTTSPAEFKAATALERAGQEVGVPLMGHEALAPRVGPGAIGQLAGDVRAIPGPGSPIISQVIEERPARIMAAAQSQIAATGPEMPADKVLSTTKDVAQAELARLDKLRTTETNKLYKAGDPIHLPVEAVTPILGRLDEALAAAPAKGALTSELRSLRDRLTTAEGAPQTLSSALSTTRRELDASLRSARGLDAGGELRQHAGVLGPISRDLRSALHDNNPWFAKGDARYTQLSRDLEAVAGTPDNPSIVRRIADASSNAELRTLMLDRENVSPATVGELAKLYRSQGRMSDLAGWFRHHLEVSLNTAAKDLQTGENPALGVKWRNLIYGDPAQRAIVDAYLTEMDSSGGALRGFQRLQQVLEHTGKTPGMGSPTATRLQGAEGLAGGAIPTGAAVAAGTALGAIGAPAGALAGGYLIGNKTLGFIRQQALKMGSRDIAEALTAPDSVARLRALARRDPASPGALSGALAVLGGRGGRESSPAKD